MSPTNISCTNNSHANTYITELICFLKENGLTYLYDGPYPATSSGSYDWIDVNTKHMSNALHKNEEKCKNNQYYITIRINNKVKYVSSNLDSIVSYFIQHSADFTICCIKKRIDLEYTFGPLEIV
jgi:hypothetical protein